MPLSRSSTRLKQRFSLRSNVLASFAANAVTAAAYIIALPIYLPYIGVEAYGLVGLFVSLQALLTVLDLGLSTTLTRELAVRTADERRDTSRDLVRTAELVQWAAALIVGAAFALSAPALARYVDPQALSLTTVAECFAIMSIALALQFPIGLYSGALFGLQQQVVFSGVSAAFTLLRNFGVIAVLHFVSPTPQAFFAWQAAIAVPHAAVLAVCVWRSLPAADKAPKFRIDLIREIWRFSAGLAMIAVVSVLITQIDKIVLVRLVPLDVFGYYAIAGIAAGGLHRLIQPIFQAFLPRLAQLAGKEAGPGLARTYHLGCQLIAVVVLPVSAVCVFFPREVLFLWQRNAAVMENAWLPFALLTAGGALNSFLIVPYALQLAHGWTRLNVYALSVSLVLLVPALILLAGLFGAPGAAAAWVALNSVLIVVLIPVMHRRLLAGEKWRWYLNDVAKPLVAVIAAAVVCKFLFVASGPIAFVAIELAAVFAIVTAAAIGSAWYIRRPVLDRLRSQRAQT